MSIKASISSTLLPISAQTKDLAPEFKPAASVVVAGITEAGDFAHAGETGTVVSADFAVGRGNTYTVSFSGTKVSHILPSMLTPA